MTTRELIKTIRDNATGTDQYNAILHRCADDIEQHIGGPEKAKEDEDDAILPVLVALTKVVDALHDAGQAVLDARLGLQRREKP